MSILEGLGMLAGVYLLIQAIDLLFASQERCSICLRRGAVWRGDKRDPNDHRCRAHRLRKVGR